MFCLLTFSIYLLAALPLQSSQRINPYTCERTPLQTSAYKLPGDNGFSIKILGNPIPEFYIPGQSYTVALNGSYSNQQFLDFMLIAVRKSDMDNEQYSAGTFTHLLDHMTKEDSHCPHIQTSVTYHPSYKKSSVSFTWMAPRSGAGCILFRATVLQHPDIWYRDDGGLTRMFCEETESTESESTESESPHNTTVSMVKSAVPNSDSDSADPEALRDHSKRRSDPCCACDVGKYEMTFVGNWSRETHPSDFPSGSTESLLHWSDIIGASHSPDYYLWRYNTLASQGVEQVCEYGWPKEMEQEIKAQSRAIRTVIKTSGIWGYPALYQAERSARFSVDKTRSFISMLTMIGPSPDWCVGLDSVNLCLSNCTWAERMEFDLYPWDAGTDSGITFQSQNAETFPREKITRLTSSHPNNPASPFYGVEPMIPMAKVILRRIGSRSPPEEVQNCAAGQTPDSEFENATDITNLDIDPTDPKCMVTEWSEFTTCSVTCGIGTKVRVRRFKTAMGSLKNCPNVKIRQSDNCLGLINECENSGTEVVDICISTPWSTWSPCSATCESGTKMRTRQYINSMGASKCDISLTDIMICHAELPDCDKAAMSIDWEMVCTQLAEPGRCSGSFSRFYWDAVAGRCLQFQYGGCRGNQNNFDTIDECQRTCGTVMPTDTEVHSGHTNVDLDINCMLTEWSQFSDCSVSCGAGIKTRTRMVKVRNQRNGTPCPKDLYQSEVCATSCDNTTFAISGSQNVDCMFSEWRAWEPCSVTCGDGVQIRQRMIKRQPQGAGAPCHGEVKEMRTCHELECADNDYTRCMLSEWGPWSDCDCSSGKMMRQRMVKRGPCSPSEPLTSAKFCDTSHCPTPSHSPVNCLVTDYSDWTPCSKTCGMGEQSRFRALIAPARYGGRCEVREGEEKEMEMRSCFAQLCPVESDGRSVDCEVGPWGQWTSCSKACGRGRKVRRRQVVDKPRHNGRPCPQMKDVKPCDTGRRCAQPPRKHKKRDRVNWSKNRQ